MHATVISVVLYICEIIIAGISKLKRPRTIRVGYSKCRLTF